MTLRTGQRRGQRLELGQVEGHPPASTFAMSKPRAATSVATRTLVLPARKSARASVRWACDMSPSRQPTWYPFLCNDPYSRWASCTDQARGPDRQIPRTADEVRPHLFVEGKDEALVPRRSLARLVEAHLPQLVQQQPLLLPSVVDHDYRLLDRVGRRELVGPDEDARRLVEEILGQPADRHGPGGGEHSRQSDRRGRAEGERRRGRGAGQAKLDDGPDVVFKALRSALSEPLTEE